MLHWIHGLGIPLFDQQHEGAYRRVLAASASGAHYVVWQERQSHEYQLCIEGSWVDVPRAELSHAVAYAEDHARQRARDTAYFASTRPG